jgi:DNA-binding MarR family transcriptional regulator
MSAGPPERSSDQLPSLGAAMEFMRLIWAMDHALHRASKRMELTIGVTGPQRLVLRIIGRFPGIPAGHLARLLHVHPSTLTGVLRRVERSGLIRRRPDPRDGRRSFLGLTARGRELDRTLHGTIEEVVQRVLAATSAAELMAARRVLERLTTALSDVVPEELRAPAHGD